MEKVSVGKGLLSGHASGSSEARLNSRMRGEGQIEYLDTSCWLSPEKGLGNWCQPIKGAQGYQAERYQKMEMER